MICALAGCSSGVASVQAHVDFEQRGVVLTVTSEGKNTFTALGASCAAGGETPCTMFVPGGLLQGGWNALPIQTKRRTDGPVAARFYVGPELFEADCDVSASRMSADASELTYDVACTFADGFSGELAGVPMVEGRGSVAASKCLGDLESLRIALERPLLRGTLPLDVVNEAGGRVRHPIPVAVPAPVVQVSIDDWASSWFEEELPLRLRAEPGANLFVDGTQVQTGDGVSVIVPVKLQRGTNRVTVEARRPGHAPAIHTLEVEGRYPDTPLLLDQTFHGPLTTTAESLVLSGRTHPKAKLYLNGRLVGHRRGRFRVDAYLEEGKNEIQLLAVVERRKDTEARPLSRIDIEVHRELELDPRLVEEARAAVKRPKVTLLADVASDPWAHTGDFTSFPMRIDEIVESPSLDGSCSALVEGTACTRRVSGHVMVGWRISRAWTCVGDEVPVVVEYDACLGAEEGDDVQVDGTVEGALGGRFRGITVERARITASSVEKLPLTEALPQDRWPNPLPSLLARGSR